MICYLVPIFVPISVDLTTRFPHAHTLPHRCICQQARSGIRKYKPARIPLWSAKGATGWVCEWVLVIQSSCMEINLKK